MGFCSQDQWPDATEPLDAGPDDHRKDRGHNRGRAIFHRRSRNLLRLRATLGPQIAQPSLPVRMAFAADLDLELGMVIEKPGCLR